MTVKKEKAKGFTLLELLIVISVLAILSVALILVLNPTENLRKGRDVQRISDLSTLKSAIAFYITNTSSPNLEGTVLGGCLANVGGVPNTAAKIFYSAELADTSACLANVAEGTNVTSGSTFDTTDFCRYAGVSGAGAIDGSGWLPIDFSSIVGGSPISNLPIDPINSIAVATAPVSSDLVYRYACQKITSDGKPSNVFEIDAQLESDSYTTGSDNKRAKDGGDNENYYEIGTNLRLIGSGANF